MNPLQPFIEPKREPRRGKYSYLSTFIHKLVAGSRTRGTWSDEHVTKFF